MPERVVVGESQGGMSGGSRGRQLRTAGATPYGERVKVEATMIRIFFLVLCMAMLGGDTGAQEPAKPAGPGGHSIVIGCLTGPDADDHYTLTSMQHRLGVQVVGGDELQKAAGEKVKLTGSWEALPGSAGKTGDAARRFKVTDIAVMEEKCELPAEVTPQSKKKQQAQKK